MSEDLQSQRYYVLERISELREQIPQAMQAMVVFRARIEKYRQTDLSAAHDTYDALRRVRDDLTQALADAQPLLMELESYALATMAGQLLRGFKGFDLMSTGYRPVYDAVCRFAQQLPEKNTVNAATIGRLMNNVKLGYYPTDPDNITLILQGISFPEGVTTNVFDPCCGCGKALRQIAQGNNCYAYGVELDESRAEEAQTRLHRVGFGSFFHSDISREAFHLLFLNPPYLSVLNESGSKARHEKRFLIESIPHLLYGGLLLYVIPYSHSKAHGEERAAQATGGHDRCSVSCLRVHRVGGQGCGDDRAAYSGNPGGQTLLRIRHGESPGAAKGCEAIPCGKTHGKKRQCGFLSAGQL